MKNLSQVSNIKDVATKEYVDAQLGNGGETLPVGSEIDFDGTAQDIPVGWEEVEDTREIYTQTERRIGTWIDNKPLYRRTYTFNLSNSLGQHFNLGISNLDKIVNYYGVAIRTNNGQPVTFPLPSNAVPSDATYMMGIQNVQPNQDIYFNTGSNIADTYTVYLSFEYTKTTD